MEMWQGPATEDVVAVEVELDRRIEEDGGRRGDEEDEQLGRRK